MSSGTTEAFPAHNLQNATMSAPSPLAASSPGFPANIAETSDIPMSPLHEGAEPFSPPSISIQTPLVTRYGRAVRQPAIYRDQIPTPLPPAKDIAPQPRPLPRVRLIVRQPFETVANIFGLWRRYWHKPSYDPDAVLELRELQNRPPQPPGKLPFIRIVQVPADSRVWVRWYGEEPGYRSGSRFARMHKIGFVPEDDPSAFGFLDPTLVIRACHLMPAIADGRTSDLMQRGHSKARGPEETDDWTKFYVGRSACCSFSNTFF